MKNKEITIYELMGLIKDYEAPKKIRLQNTIYEYDKNINGYFDEDGYNLFYLIMNNDILNSKAEILSEENDEWKDIEELDIEYQYAYKSINIVLNKLIKNQKYLKERLDKNELR